MNKPNNIRKKALDYAKKRQWDKALAEFSRLVEVEQHNPNLFNEIGDIQLKLGNKHEAFKRYHEAIDAYAKIGLHNNAVAVCKKILRLNPNDDIVYGKMAALRNRQGFEREAVDYSLTFLEKIAGDSGASGDDVRALVLELTETFDTVPNVLERAAEFFLGTQSDKNAGLVLAKLAQLYLTRGMTAEHQRTVEKMGSIGYVSPVSSEPAPKSEKLETVESHRGSRRFDEGMSFNGTVPPHIRRGHEGDGASDFGVVDVGASKPAPQTDGRPAVGPPTESPAPDAGATRRAREFDPDPSALEKERLWSRARPLPEPSPPNPKPTLADDSKGNPREYVIPAPGESVGKGAETNLGVLLDGKERDADAKDQDFSALAAEVKADVDEDDYRSHYDLGMAYLEMALFGDAIREFQFAANSPTYQVRSLEMIGRCLINQDQPKLAVKQLTKGLTLVEGDDRTALGIKYNLALAYEMVGEVDKAKTLFEDIYVVDVTFRDVEERVKKYSP